MKKTNSVLVLLALLALSACAPANQNEQDKAAFAKLPAETTGSALQSSQKIDNLDQILTTAEGNASTEAALVLKKGHAMIDAKDIVVGSCWDYIDEVYNKAGYPQKDRLTIFRSSRDDGPYAQVSDIQAGDWLYFVNHSFHDHEHSAIFVAWIDFEAKEALMISYAGGDQKVAARYHTYILSSVYNIMRPKPAKK